MTKQNISQPELFDLLGNAYIDREELSNKELYKILSENQNNSDSKSKLLLDFSNHENFESKYNTTKRRVRWVQQTLKHLGLLTNVGKRGVWKLTDSGKKKFKPLHEINNGHIVIAFSTKLGIAIWADCKSLFSDINEPISLCISSPPYPLNTPKAYGNVNEAEYVDWICSSIEPIVKNLRCGGSIVLNVGNDVFIKGLPARSTYRERLVIAFQDNLGLYKMDEIPWINTSKPPGPIIWASITRQQLNTAWEPVYWFTNDPIKCLSNNNRILQPHSHKHLEWLKNGGARDETPRSNSDGAHNVTNKSYNKVTNGKIPKNVYIRGHRCVDQNNYKLACQELGIQSHGATFPLDFAKFFIEFLTSIDDLVVDPFGGSLTVAKASEILKRRWITTEKIWEYIRGGMTRFNEPEVNSEFIQAF